MSEPLFSPTDASSGQAARGAANLCLAAPLFLSLVGTVLLLAAAGPTVAAGLAAVVLAATGLGIGRLLARRQDGTLAAARQAADMDMARLTQLYTESAPIWIRQLETVRCEADTEVGQLTRVFGNITQKLDQAIGLSAGAPSRNGNVQDEVLAALARNGQELETLVAALRLLQTSKQRIVEEIGAEAARLKENASEIRQIALHIRMVALNATIEAARAGAAGKPFAVIVSDMRELAVRTAEASELFSRNNDRLHGMIGAAFREQVENDSRIVSIAGAEELVRKVVASSEAMLRKLTRAIAAMEGERQGVREDISQVLVSLQFQDRVSQILSHVTRNLEDMQAHLRSGDAGEIDERQWLERMAGTYSTSEEFENHAGTRPSAVQPAAAVTFF
jgi:methyl-accepting chemotaxis protein